jgi:hypothetical protein
MEDGFLTTPGLFEDLLVMRVVGEGWWWELKLLDSCLGSV